MDIGVSQSFDKLRTSLLYAVICPNSDYTFQSDRPLIRPLGTRQFRRTNSIPATVASLEHPAFCWCDTNLLASEVVDNEQITERAISNIIHLVLIIGAGWRALESEEQIGGSAR